MPRKLDLEQELKGLEAALRTEPDSKRQLVTRVAIPVALALVRDCIENDDKVSQRIEWVLTRHYQTPDQAPRVRSLSGVVAEGIKLLSLIWKVDSETATRLALDRAVPLLINQEVENRRNSERLRNDLKEELGQDHRREEVHSLQT